MSKINKTPRTKSKGLIIGRKGFEKISAVEGIRMSREMKATFKSFDKTAASAEARRYAIVKKYGK
ncbi:MULTISPECIES: hypothetical protein [Bradyrhizobium]|jgi:hypothetical protein|uniref:hypothetical protein n=1 Tax=Bradyrhizobium TaxID=374 RepID=UPI00041BE8F6|nr:MULTISPECIES: hypothetical protein [Bradyrhizobium]AUC97992.1 hypothetical protein CWS35_29945 [Bradyrhizobium sp. SK17]KIU43449.1 hypothetical protein QU41_35940 [Bradyrhizobium elkanii]OCX28680.1 hypothetical protein QU42_21750 [Bradyrhizobium sp. UASWS1016]